MHLIKLQLNFSCFEIARGKKFKTQILKIQYHNQKPRKYKYIYIYGFKSSYATLLNMCSSGLKDVFKKPSMVNNCKKI